MSRLDTLEKIRNAGINVCCGDIVRMRESRRTHAGLIAQFAKLDPCPESVPINHFCTDVFDLLEFVRMIAAIRITMPEAIQAW